MATGIGIDIGAQWIKIVQVKCSGKGVTVTGACKLPNFGGDSGLPPNFALELKKARLRRTGTLGITGREVNLKYEHIPPVPPEKLKVLLNMHFGSQNIPGAPAEGGGTTYDYRILNVPAGLNSDMTVMANIVKTEYLQKQFDTFKSVGVKLHAITPSVFGLTQAYLRTQQIPEGECVVLVDVGHQSMEIAILSEQQVYFARNAPGGGSRFEQALQRGLEIPVEKAIQYKHERVQLYTDGTKMPDEKALKIQNALKPGADAIASAIRAALMFCRTQGKMKNLDYKRVFLSGGGARLPGLSAYLEDKIKRPVQAIDLHSSLDLRRLDAISAACFQGEVPDMTVALGLAIIDAQPNSFHLRLIPEKIKKRQEFWRKPAWAIAGSVVFMSGLILPSLVSRESMEETGMKQGVLQQKLNEAAQLKKKFAAEKKANEALDLKRTFYARQTRLGKVYLNLFAALRAHAPQGVTFTNFAPEGSLDGATANALDPFGNSIQRIVIRGFYDTGTIKEFNTATSAFFSKIKEVNGVENITLALDYRPGKDEDPGPGRQGFQFNLVLKSADSPLLDGKKIQSWFVDDSERQLAGR